MTTAYDFTLPSLQGAPLDLSTFRGRPLLIVNTASKCGFTPQYAGLQRLWVELAPTGLVVIGVPSNDFGGQEPGSGREIETFCRERYSIVFPMAAKLPVKGPNAHPLFQWLAQEGGFWARPRWNFYKYLVGRDGALAAWFSSLTPPDARPFRSRIDRVLRS